MPRNLRRARSPRATSVVPGPGPADEVEERVDDAGGEAPQQHVLVGPDHPAGPLPPGRVPHAEPVRGVEQLLDRHAEDRVHLGRVDDADRGSRLVPVAQHRGDREVARRQPDPRQHREHLDAGRGRARSPPPPRAARPRPATRRPVESSRRGTTPGPAGSACRGPARSAAGRGRRGRRRRAPAPRPRGAPASSGGTKRVRSSAVIVRSAVAHRLQPVGQRGRRSRRAGGVGRPRSEPTRSGRQPTSSVILDEAHELVVARTSPARNGRPRRPRRRRPCREAAHPRSVLAADPPVEVGEQRVGHAGLLDAAASAARRAGSPSRRRAPGTSPCPSGAAAGSSGSSVRHGAHHCAHSR